MLPTIQRPEAIGAVAPCRLVVARYGVVDPARMVPLQNSIGRPKWASYEIVAWPAVMPWGLFGAGLDPEDFRRAYRRRLHQRTPPILAELDELLDAYDPFPLASCCFEDLRDGSRRCHRTVLSDWLFERLGVPVPEVGEVRPTPIP
jgi:hypothetical protein